MTMAEFSLMLLLSFDNVRKYLNTDKLLFFSVCNIPSRGGITNIPGFAEVALYHGGVGLVVD